jgi:hypothetical protein
MMDTFLASNASNVPRAGRSSLETITTSHRVDGFQQPMELSAMVRRARRMQGTFLRR